MNIMKTERAYEPDEPWNDLPDALYWPGWAVAFLVHFTWYALPYVGLALLAAWPFWLAWLLGF